MGTLVGLIADSPSAGRVLEAGLLASRAYGLRQRYVHVSPQTAAAGGISDRLRSLAESIVGDAGLIETVSLDRVDETTLGLCGDDGPPSLLVLGAVPREGVVRDVVGSTARRLALRSACSVMLVSTAGPSPARWRRFVVSVRYTPAGERVAQAVASLANAANADGDKASLTFAWDVRRPHSTDGVPRPFDLGNTDRAGMSAEHFKLAAFADGVTTEYIDTFGVCLEGRPGQEVSRYAEDARADLLGVAAPDEPMGFLSRLLSHPVRLVLDRLPCSVLICRRGGPGTTGEVAPPITTTVTVGGRA